LTFRWYAAATIVDGRSSPWLDARNAHLRDWNEYDDGAYTEWEDAPGNMQLLCIDNHPSGQVVVPVSLVEVFHSEGLGRVSIRLVNERSDFDVTLNVKEARLPEPKLYGGVPYYVFVPSDYVVEWTYPGFKSV
jgi:hypothetical protein